MDSDTALGVTMPSSCQDHLVGKFQVKRHPLSGMTSYTPMLNAFNNYAGVPTFAGWVLDAGVPTFAGLVLVREKGMRSASVKRYTS